MQGGPRYVDASRGYGRGLSAGVNYSGCSVPVGPRFGLRRAHVPFGQLLRLRPARAIHPTNHANQKYAFLHSDSQQCPKSCNPFYGTPLIFKDLRRNVLHNIIQRCSLKIGIRLRYRFGGRCNSEGRGDREAFDLRLILPVITASRPIFMVPIRKAKLTAVFRSSSPP